MSDIQVFINEKGTGPKIPEPEIFVDYMDDPTKTFQQHTIANFPCPPELLPNDITHTEPQPKPELTVRNPTANTVITPLSPIQQHKEESKLLQRVKSINVNPNPVASILNDPPTPSKSSNIEKRKSITRSGIKPLPSISTPIAQQRQHQRKASFRENYSSRSQQPPPPPPVLIVPEISSSSTTSASEEDDTPVNRKFRSNKKREEEEDITIDPRAKVVFAIGNNMFDLGHLDLNEKNKTDTAPSATRRLTSTRRRQPSADIEAACNFSYQSLLEELGVFDKSENNSSSSKSSQISKDSDTVESKRISRRISTLGERRLSVRQKQSQQQSPVEDEYPASHNNMIHSGSTVNNGFSQQQQQNQQQLPHHQVHPQQQDVYLNNDVYRQQQQLTQQSQQQYYNQQYPTQAVAQPIGQPLNSMMNHNYHSTQNSNMYNPPSSSIPQHGHKPTLFWGN